MKAETELQKNFSKLKDLEACKPLENNIDDILCNLNHLIGYFNAIKQYGASNTVYCAEQVIKSFVNDINDIN